MKQEEKVLTRDIVMKLGLDKVNVIISDMIEGYTSIGDRAFEYCSSLTSITIPNSVTSIGWFAFNTCSALTSIVIPNSVTSIGYSAFNCCFSLTSITIPNSIKSIGKFAFYKCKKLDSIVIGNKVYKKHEVIKNKCKAYKSFRGDMTCRGFKYEEGKTYEIDREPKLCKYGFHACLNILDVFNYYNGNLGKDVVVHEVELKDVSDEKNKDYSKVVAKKITIGKQIL